MKLYSDIFSDDELISDSYDLEELHDVVYKVASKKVKAGQNEDFGISANLDEDDEGTGNAESGGDSGTMVNELVQSFNLNSAPYTKKEYVAHIKDYSKRLKEHLEKNQPERVESFMKNLNVFIKGVIENFNDYEFYQGESNSTEGMVVLMNYSNDGMTQYLYYFKDGMKARKL
jgi:hypothetical protein